MLLDMIQAVAPCKLACTAHHRPTAALHAQRAVESLACHAGPEAVP